MTGRPRRERRKRRVEEERQIEALTADILAGNYPAMLPERRALVPRNLPRPAGLCVLDAAIHILDTSPPVTAPQTEYNTIAGYDPEDTMAKRPLSKLEQRALSYYKDVAPSRVKDALLELTFRNRGLLDDRLRLTPAGHAALGATDEDSR